VDQRLDLRRHLAKLLHEGSAGGAGEQRRDDRDDEGATPDFPHRFRGRGRLDDREPFGFKSASDFLAFCADFVNDKDGRHRDLSTGRST
jgi:hypothetical protein